MDNTGTGFGGGINAAYGIKWYCLACNLHGKERQLVVRLDLQQQEEMCEKPKPRWRVQFTRLAMNPTGTTEG